MLQDLVAFISGGNRWIGTSMPSALLSLDASGSFDPDTPKGVEDGLTFEWSCFDVNKEACRNSIAPFETIELPQGPILNINAGLFLKAGKTYSFEVLLCRTNTFTQHILSDSVF